MMFSKPITEVIRARRSVRTYDVRPLGAELQADIERMLSQTRTTVFHNTVRLQLVDKDYAASSNIKLGTYGFIKGGRWFLAGAVRTGDKCCIDFGYAMEKAILFLTANGLGTCWLGGTLSRREFGRAIALRKEEEIPAVTPIGYPSTERSWMEKLLRVGVHSSRRKPWGKLFYDGDFATPLGQEAAGLYASPLEMVQLGPSAENIQPWRVIRDGNRRDFHFYLKRTILSSLYRATDLQHLDMGIALCHFELTAREAGRAGDWTDRDPCLSGNPGWEYIATWQCGE